MEKDFSEMKVSTPMSLKEKVFLVQLQKILLSKRIYSSRWLVYLSLINFLITIWITRSLPCSLLMWKAVGLSPRGSPRLLPLLSVHDGGTADKRDGMQSAKINRSRESEGESALVVSFAISNIISLVGCGPTVPPSLPTLTI